MMYLVTILRNIPFQALHAVWVVNQLFHSFRQFHFAKKGSLVYFPDQLNYLSSFFFYEIKFSKKSLYALPCLTFFSKNMGVGWRKTPPYTHTNMNHATVECQYCTCHVTWKWHHTIKKIQNFLNLSFFSQILFRRSSKVWPQPQSSCINIVTSYVQRWLF